ncbi:hypothetical protein J2Y55_004108 [Bosea sp. BE125]|nr:hypothetical protein [Bosea sp. BE125]
MMIRSALEHHQAIDEMMSILATTPPKRNVLRQAELSEAIDAWECVNCIGAPTRAPLAPQSAATKTMIAPDRTAHAR